MVTTRAMTTAAEAPAVDSEDGPIINDGTIEQSMALINYKILGLALHLTKTVELDQYSWPSLADLHLSSPKCYDLFRIVLGFDEGERLDAIFRRLKVKLGDVGVYVRALVAAHMYSRILLPEPSHLDLFDRSEVEAIFGPKAQARKSSLADPMDATRGDEVKEALSMPQQLNTITR